MGTCCGKPTVWNDMCEDCNDKYEDMIYAFDDHYDEEEAKPFNSIIESEVFSVLFDLRDVLFIEGHYIDRDTSKGMWARLVLRITFKDKVDLFIDQTKVSCETEVFTSECNKIKEKFKQYKGLH